MFNKMILASIFATVSFGAHALSIDLGAASDYNVFVKESFNQPGSVIDGKLAVGGNANIGQTDIGVKYSGQSQDVLNVGGNLTTAQWAWGNIKGNANVGGTLNANNGKNVAQGSLNQGQSINFDSEFAALTNLSKELSGLANTGTTDFLYNNWLILNGASTNGLYVANITSDQLWKATELTGTGLTSTDTLVVNVSGVNVNFDSLNYGMRENLAALNLSSSNILYNFYEAENINFLYGGFSGTILAPNANLTFNSGRMTGQMIVNSWSGNWGSHAALGDSMFSGYEYGPPSISSSSSANVSESSSWALSLIGLIALLALRFRRTSGNASAPTAKDVESKEQPSVAIS